MLPPRRLPAPLLAPLLLTLSGCPTIVWDAPNDTPGCFGRSGLGECGCLAVQGCAWCADDPGTCTQVNRRDCREVRDSNVALCGPVQSLDAGVSVTDGGAVLASCPNLGDYRCYAGTEYVEACESVSGALGWAAINGYGVCIEGKCEEPATDKSYFICTKDRSLHQVLEGRPCVVEGTTACRYQDVARCDGGVWTIVQHCNNDQCARVPGTPDAAPVFACDGPATSKEGDPCGALDRTPTCSHDNDAILTCVNGRYDVVTDCDALGVACVMPASPGEPTCGP